MIQQTSTGVSQRITQRPLKRLVHCQLFSLLKEEATWSSLTGILNSLVLLKIQLMFE